MSMKSNESPPITKDIGNDTTPRGGGDVFSSASVSQPPALSQDDPLEVGLHPIADPEINTHGSER